MFSSISFNAAPAFHTEQPSSSELAWSLVNEYLKAKNLDKTFKKGTLSPLEIAVELKDLDLCKGVKAAQGRLDPKKPFMESLLMRAISNSTESIALWLIEEGVDINGEDSATGFNVLHQAAGLGKISVAEALIKTGMSIDCISKQPFPQVEDNFPERLKTPYLTCTPLFFATTNRQPQMVKALIQLGADANLGHSVLNPFYLAFLNNWTEVLQVFAEEHCINNILVDGDSFLYHCILCLDNGDLKKLLNLGINANQKDSDGKSALYIAIQYNCLEAAKLLVENGATVNDKHQTKTLLYFALQLDRMDLFQYLLEKGANPNLPGDEEGYTPLHLAALMNKEEFAEILVRHKAIVDVIDANRETPLFKVANRKSHRIARLLLENGSAPNHLNKKNETPLHRAALQDDVETARLLVEHGSSVNAQDCDEKRPLHRVSSEEMADFLLDAGADARVLDKVVNTPLGILMHRSLITDNNFAKLKKKDAGLTDTIYKLTLLGHRFSLKGTWVEGFTTKFTFPEIASSWNDFLATQPVELQNRCKDVSACFLATSKFKYDDSLGVDSPVLKSFRNKELVILPLGWTKGNHSVVLTMMDRYVVRGNQGKGTEDPGLAIFEMKHPKQALEAIVKLLTVLKKKPTQDDVVNEQKARNGTDSFESIESELQQTYTKEAIDYFNSILMEDVDLTSLFHLKKKGQDSGNCTWKAAKLGLLSSLIILFMKETGDLQVAIQQAKLIYKKWCQFDYERSLKNLQEIVNEPFLNTELVDELCAALFLKCIKKKKISWMEHILTIRPQLNNWKGKDTAMTFLCAAKDRRTIGWLVSHGMDPLAEDQQGESILDMAIKSGNLPLVSYLVEERNCRLTKGSMKMTPLVTAICADEAAIATYLISKGADPRDNDAYFYALGENSEMEAIFTNYRDAKGRTLLFMETLPRVARKLIKAGISLDAVDTEGNTVFHYLCKSKEYCVMEDMVSLLPNLEVLKQTDANGNTLLHLLAGQEEDYGARDVLKAMFSSSQVTVLACLTMKNRQGLSPLHILLKKPPDYDIWNLLEKMFEAIGEIDLLALKDNEGNNLMHLLFSHPDDYCRKKISAVISAKAKEQFPLLMNAKNHSGVTPSDL